MNVVPTSIGVQERTRNALERVKREINATSLDATLAALLAEHEELKARQASARLLRSIREKRVELARMAARHGIRSLAVFGSTLHGDARPDSDLDLLAVFEKGRTPGLIAMGSIERELSKLLAVPIDLQTPASLSKHIRDQVLAEALEIYGTS